MKLTVDASIVVKWFVAEPMSDEARLVLGRRVRLHAPEIVLAEFANTIWKKARRKEVPDPGPYLAELATLPDVLELCPARHLAERAAQFAFELDHPIYDCLYLACAEITDSDLITADKRFAGKAAEHLQGARVRYIGEPGVADSLGAAAIAPVIEKETVDALIAAYEIFEKTEQSVLGALTRQGPGPRILSVEDQELFLNSPSYRHLVDSIRKLSLEERIDLLALGWLCAGLFPDWRRSFAHAERMVASLDPKYAAGYGHNWRVGYARVMGCKPRG